MMLICIQHQFRSGYGRVRHRNTDFICTKQLWPKKLYETVLFFFFFALGHPPNPGGFPHCGGGYRYSALFLVGRNRPSVLSTTVPLSGGSGKSRRPRTIQTMIGCFLRPRFHIVGRQGKPPGDFAEALRSLPESERTKGPFYAP